MPGCAATEERKLSFKDLASHDSRVYLRDIKGRFHSYMATRAIDIVRRDKNTLMIGMSIFLELLIELRIFRIYSRF